MFRIERIGDIMILVTDEEAGVCFQTELMIKTLRNKFMSVLKMLAKQAEACYERLTKFEILYWDGKNVFLKKSKVPSHSGISPPKTDDRDEDSIMYSVLERLDDVVDGISGRNNEKYVGVHYI